MRRIVLALPAIVVLFLAAPASGTGLYSCESGKKSDWKSMEELEAKMKADGWTVRRIKEDGGCSEAYGTSPEGQRVEAYFHPVTLEKHLVARRGEVLFRKEN
ncbi:MAG: PepSY domain-containing protein [Rhizobiaceae bacterium]